MIDRTPHARYSRALLLASLPIVGLALVADEASAGGHRRGGYVLVAPADEIPTRVVTRRVVRTIVPADPDAPAASPQATAAPPAPATAPRRVVRRYVEEVVEVEGPREVAPIRSLAVVRTAPARSTCRVATIPVVADRLVVREVAPATPALLVPARSCRILGH